MLSATTFVAYLTLGLAAFSSAVSANPTIPSLTIRDINPQGIEFRSVDTLYTGDVLPRTNGERMKRGLGPLPPKRRHAGSRLEARQSQAPCVPKTATIAATYTNGNGAVQNGWVRSFTNSLGEYGFTPLASSALQISYCALPSGNAAFDILMTNGATTYPYLGAAAGVVNTNNDFSTGSFNYAYLAGTGQTAPGATPADGPNSHTGLGGTPLAIESDIWHIGSGNSLSATWINTDGSAAPTHLVYVETSDAFVITGDVNTFINAFSGSYTCTLTLVTA